MSTYNLNALLQDDQPSDGLVDAGEQSLNDDFDIPDDGLSVEVKVDPKLVADLVRGDDEITAETAVLESRHNEWSYLRDDIINARGMCTQFALEAIAIKPSFGDNKPLGYYSKHVSHTRYTAALEEIDTTMHQDVLTYLEKLKARLDTLTATARAIGEQDCASWEQLKGAVSLFGVYFKDGQSILEKKGQAWDDMTLITAASANAEESLRQELSQHFVSSTGFTTALAETGDLYTVSQEFAMILDMITEHCDKWAEKVSNYTEGLTPFDREKKLKVEVEAPLKVALANGNNIGLSDLGNYLRKLFASTFEYQSSRTEALTVNNYLFALASAAQQSNVSDLNQRHLNLIEKLEGYSDVITQLTDAVAKTGTSQEGMTFVTTEVNQFATKLFDVYDAAQFVLEEMQTVVNQYRSSLRKALGLAMLLVETKNQQLQSVTDPAILEDAEFLPSWKEAVEKMRNSLAFLC